jgi:cytochrome c-type biogenesis protein CcmH/NrfG
VELAPQQVGKIIDLARFLMRQGRYQEAEQSFARAEKVAPNSPGVIFGRASVYVEAHRNLDIARELLKRYMTMDLQPDDPPKREAARLLRVAYGG